MSPRPYHISALPLPDPRPNRRAPSVGQDVWFVVQVATLAFVLFVDVWLFMAL